MAEDSLRWTKKRMMRMENDCNDETNDYYEFTERDVGIKGTVILRRKTFRLREKESKIIF